MKQNKKRSEIKLSRKDFEFIDYFAEYRNIAIGRGYKSFLALFLDFYNKEYKRFKLRK